MEQELAGGVYPDQRLKTRLGRLLSDLGQRIGDTVPMACQDWAATKAAYRFFANPRVDENMILAGHFQATTRAALHSEPLLVLHDTTEFSFQRRSPDAVGYLSYVKGRHATHTACGVLLHSSLVLTTTGLPLGLAAVTFWTRKRFKGTNACQRHVNPTRVPIEDKESYRWLANLKQATERLGNPDPCVHIGDRESDIDELFVAAHEVRTRFLIRTSVNRLAGRGRTTVAKILRRQPIRGYHEIEVRDAEGHVRTARLAIRYCQRTVHPPIGKKARYPSLTLTVIQAREVGTPKGQTPIRWPLLTNGSVGDRASAIEKLTWYALRWKLEVSTRCSNQVAKQNSRSCGRRND